MCEFSTVQPRATTSCMEKSCKVLCVPLGLSVSHSVAVVQKLEAVQADLPSSPCNCQDQLQALRHTVAWKQCAFTVIMCKSQAQAQEAWWVEISSGVGSTDEDHLDEEDEGPAMECRCARSTSWG